MKVGYNIVDNESLINNEVEILRNKMSITEFLKRVKKEEDIPLDICITGLDTLIAYAEKPLDLSKFIKKILIEKSNFLLRQNLVIQFLMDGKLQVTDDDSKPKSVIDKNIIEVNHIFGKLKREYIHYFFTQLNLSS